MISPHRNTNPSFPLISPKLIVLVVISMLTVQAQSAMMHTFLRHYQMFCFEQDIPKHSIFKLKAVNQQGMLLVEITYGRKTFLNHTVRQVFDKSMTSQQDGIYRVCMTNIADMDSKFSFDFVYGARANDYGSHFFENKDYITTLENQAQFAEAFAAEIGESNREGLNILSKDRSGLNGYGNDYFFTIIFIAVILVLSYGQYRVVRSHMIKKKYM